MGWAWWFYRFAIAKSLDIIMAIISCHVWVWLCFSNISTRNMMEYAGITNYVKLSAEMCEMTVKCSQDVWDFMGSFLDRRIFWHVLMATSSRSPTIYQQISLPMFATVICHPWSAQVIPTKTPAGRSLLPAGPFILVGCGWTPVRVVLSVSQVQLSSELIRKVIHYKLCWLRLGIWCQGWRDP